MKLTTLIETMSAKQVSMLAELKEVLALHGDVDVYRGDMIPFDGDHLDEQLYVDMVAVTEAMEPEKYPNGYLHLGAW